MPSFDLQPGTRLRHKDGAVVTLDRRKSPEERLDGPHLPGWWLVEKGGLADFVIDHPQSPWTELIDGQEVQG